MMLKLTVSCLLEEEITEEKSSKQEEDLPSIPQWKHGPSFFPICVKFL